MNPDLAFVLGVIVLGLAVPAVISAFTDSRPPRAAAICFVIGGGLLVYALGSGQNYSFAEVPAVFTRVFGAWLR